jgi:EAL domain-containing protein (putative c-di-GMP-specific phosphodiesterase class I)/GGDEF domain-containing protein
LGGSAPPSRGNIDASRRIQLSDQHSMNDATRPDLKIWRVLAAAAVLFIIAFLVESFWHRSVIKERVMDMADQRLLRGAIIVEEFLRAEQYSAFNPEQAAGLTSPQSFIDTSRILTNLANKLDLSQIYMIVELDGQKRISADTDLVAEAGNEPFSMLYDPIENSLLDFFNKNTTSNEPFYASDELQQHRILLYPLTQTSVPAWIGVEESSEDINRWLDDELRHALWGELGLMLMVIPVGLLIFLPLRRVAYTHRISGLRNSNQLHRDLARNPPAYLALINIDRFNQINAAFGVSDGEHLLRSVARRLERALPDTKFYHLSGDQFAMLFDSPHPHLDLENLLETLEQENDVLQDNEVHVRYGAGFATTSVMDPIREAEMALVYARRHRKSIQDARALEESEASAREHLHIVSQLQTALRTNSLIVHYMPLLNLHDQTITRYEALARIRLPNGDGENLMPPSTFLPAAYQYRLRTAITRAVLTQALEAFRQRSETISINLTFDDLADERQLHWIIGQVSTFPDPARINFELLETDLFIDEAMGRHGLNLLQEVGAGISIDDFGMGYSNFAVMDKLGVQMLKIDGALIRKLDPEEGSEGINRQAKNVIQGILGVAQELQIQTCAEFVHNQNLLEICTQMGIDYAQGYAIGEPAPLT